MPRRKDTNEWKTDARGRYRRMVGWKIEGGKRVQQPFYFGTDLDQAKARYLRVRELWAHLERTHAESLKTLNSRFELPEPTECLWDWESLWVARELAAGRVQIVLPPPQGLPATAYVSMIDQPAKRYPMVYFVPEEAVPETRRDSDGRDGIAVWVPLTWGLEAPCSHRSAFEAGHELPWRQDLSSLDPGPLRPAGPCARRQAPRR